MHIRTVARAQGGSSETNGELAMARKRLGYAITNCLKGHIELRCETPV